jgi:hypothetical protein
VIATGSGPPERERPGPHPETGPNHKALADTNTLAENNTVQPRQCIADTVAGLHRRRQASWRLAELESRRSDPWSYAPSSAGYEDAAAHLLELGLTPAPNLAGLHEMWKAGGESRAAAQVIAERWDLAA